MADSGVRMQAVLEGYAKFLKEKDLALPKHQAHLVRRVREFLLFAQEHGFFKRRSFNIGFGFLSSDGITAAGWSFAKSLRAGVNAVRSIRAFDLSLQGKIE